MPATFFTNPPTRTMNFIRNTASQSSTSAAYYQFLNYAVPSAPSPSEMVICRNEENHATTIITPRLIFRSFNQIEEADLMAGLRDIFMDPVNVQQYWDGVAWSEEKINVYIQEYRAAWEQGKKFSVYAIYDVLNPDKIIGTLDLREDFTFADYKNTVELGYILLMSEHGKKIGREIGEVGWQAFVHEVETAIHTENTPRTALAATAHPDNHASMSILTHVLGKVVPGITLSYGVTQPRNLFYRPYTPFLSASPHNQLLCNAETFCKDNQDHDDYLEAIKNKNYSLALRKACAAGVPLLINLILQYKTSLDIDINQPSSSNGWTALDWIEKNQTIEPTIKASIIHTLVQHQAEHGNAAKPQNVSSI